MPRRTLSQDDINRSKILPPGWQYLRVTKYTEEAAGTDGSALDVYELKVIEGPFKDVPLRFQVSEKAMGMGAEFWEVCGMEVKPGQPIEVEKAVGKTLDGFVQRGEYKGRPNNQLVSFRRHTTTAV